jgi:hypothetical protein
MHVERNSIDLGIRVVSFASTPLEIFFSGFQKIVEDRGELTATYDEKFKCPSARSSFSSMSPNSY